MHGLTQWFIRNPVAANLMMVLILVAGWLTVSSIRIEGFPKLPADALEITTLYSRAHVEQVDQQVTRKIEKALEGLAGIKKVTSVSTEGLSSVTVQRVEGYPLERLSDDIRARLDAIYGLPVRAEKPIITRNDFDLAALIVQLYGDTDAETLQAVATQVRETLLSLPEISKLKTWGRRQAEVRIELDAQHMLAFGLSSEDIVHAMQAASFEDVSGELDTQGGKITVRAHQQRDQKREMELIPLRALPNGRQILLKDVARVVDDFEDDGSMVRFNGLPGIGMEVLIGRDENLLEIADAVKTAMKALKPQLPAGIELVSWADSSHYISERLSLLKDNALQGLLLVFVLLAVFLNIKLAFWVAMGIPVSIAGALALMGSDWIGYSLNDITTFGLIIALGILVDDAVVVGESVFEERTHTQDAEKGTALGVKKVATATIYGVLTTIAAFFPMLLIDNAMGKILASFAGVVILTLIFSLLESKFILPAHLAAISLNRSSGARPERSAWGWLAALGRWVQRAAQGALDWVRFRCYAPTLRFCLHHRYAVLVLFLSLAVLGLGLIGKGAIRTVFFPDIPGQIVSVQVEMDPRAPLALTRKNALQIEGAVAQLNASWQKTFGFEAPPIQQVLNVVTDASAIEMYAELSLPQQRTELSARDIAAQWREASGSLEGVSELVFSASEEAGGGFAVQLFSKNDQAMREASQQIVDFLQQQPGLSNVRQSLKPGQPEIKLQLKDAARQQGFTDQLLAAQVGERFGGSEAYRIQRGTEEVKVIVKGAPGSRNEITDLGQLRVKNDQGIWFPVVEIAHLTHTYQTSYVARRDGKRVNTIYVSVDKAIISPSELGSMLFAEVVPGVSAAYPDVEIKAAGELEEIFSIKGSLIKALIFTCLLIYVLLAVPLKSYVQPLVIMSVVPFGFIGAAFGHLIMGVPLSLLSFFGMLALAGVVVNDSLVMLSRYNQSRESGLSAHDALMDSGVGRFKAIFLTTTTTVAGLTPLMLETSEQAQYLIPAAISLAFGEIFATAITLVLIPLLIAVGLDVKQLVVRPAQDCGAGQAVSTPK